MRDDRFLRALGDIDDSYVDGALEDIRPAPARPVKRIVILAACAAVLAATLLFAVPAMIKGRGTTPPAGTPLASESETNSGMEPLTDEPKQTDPRETETDVDTGIETGHKETDQKPGPMGGTNVCTVHSVMSYHSYSQEMIDLVGEENFNEWINASEKSVPRDGCAFPDSNVFQFINHFGIKREELEQVYYNTPCYYNRVLNLDVLYSGDFDLVDEYYRNMDYLDSVREKRQALLIFKSSIRNGDPDLWTETFGSDKITPQTSAKAAVDAYGLSRETIEALVAKEAAKRDYIYDYNIDALFDRSMDGLSPMEQDALFCGITDPMTE